MALRSIPIHRAGTRDSLFMSGDREMVMMAGVIAAALIFSAQTWFATLAGLFIWFFSLYMLRLAAKKDPKMRQVYLRSLRYRRYYSARSTPFRVNGTIQGKGYQ